MMKSYRLKVIVVRYSFLFNRPNRRAIERHSNKLGRRGYRFVSRQERPTGCLKMLFTCLLARGSSELTFVKGFVKGNE